MVSKSPEKTLELIFDFGSPNAYLTLKVLPELLERTGAGLIITPCLLGGIQIGLAICYDLRFPELFKHYARAGADVVIVPASWQDGPGKVDQWRLLARARALDATCYVIAAGQAEPAASGRPGGKGPLGVGHSLAVGPDGTVLHEAGDAPEVFVVDIDPDAVARARATLPVLANSRFASSLRAD